MFNTFGNGFLPVFAAKFDDIANNLFEWRGNGGMVNGIFAINMDISVDMRHS